MSSTSTCQGFSTFWSLPGRRMEESVALADTSLMDVGWMEWPANACITYKEMGYMKIVAVTANPDPLSMTNAAGNALLDGAAEGGAQTELIDLCAEGFNPVYGMEDREHYLGRGPMPDDVLAMQSRIRDADALALVFPIYWYTMPAIMKGFFDRVLCRGFSYDADGTPGALAGKTIRIVMLSGGGEDWYRSSGIGQALDNQIRQQTFIKYCRAGDVSFTYIDNLRSGDDEPEARQAADRHLVSLALMGRELALGDRTSAESGDAGARS